MSYDNTKFNLAFAAWREANTEPCALDGTYGGNLMDDFCEFLSSTGMMKRSPGRVVFGQALRDAGFESYRSVGLTYWGGIALKKPRPSTPRRYTKTLEQAELEAQARERLQREKLRLDNDQEREERRRCIQTEIESETEDRARQLEEAELERLYTKLS